MAKPLSTVLGVDHKKDKIQTKDLRSLLDAALDNPEIKGGSQEVHDALSMLRKAVANTDEMRVMVTSALSQFGTPMYADLARQAGAQVEAELQKARIQILDIPVPTKDS